MRSSRLYSPRFIDKVKLQLFGGDGGNGNPRLKRSGGNGANIIFVAKNKVTLCDIIKEFPGYKIYGDNGESPIKGCLVGKDAPNKFVNVPKGVDVKLKSDKFLGSLNNDGDEMLVCRGGLGGTPNNNFLAQKGEVVNLRLDIKLIADIGLVGFPNAGKSTFLSSISGAKVKIANYPFTTLRPKVCTMNYKDGRAISLSDLPGIIEGAHVNVGLGHHFLKHIERTKLLLFVIDLFGFRLDRSRRIVSKYRSALETILLLMKELELYSQDLLQKPAICLLNKIDRPHGPEIANYVIDSLDESKGGILNWAHSNAGNLDFELPNKPISFSRVLPISAQTGDGVATVKQMVREVLDEKALEDRALQSQIEDKISELDKGFEETTAPIL